MDQVSSNERSQIMKAVRSRGNRSTEARVGKMLWAAGFRGYRKHWPILGKPDFCWPGRKLTLFVDGCFWHVCPRCKKIPSSNEDYWSHKIARNRQRDRQVNRTLRKQGWTVLRIRECELKKPDYLEQLIAVYSTGTPAKANPVHNVEVWGKR